jgi:hypothetical protein
MERSSESGRNLEYVEVASGESDRPSSIDERGFGLGLGIDRDRSLEEEMWLGRTNKTARTTSVARNGQSCDWPTVLDVPGGEAPQSIAATPLQASA